MNTPFPFSAIVGQDNMKLALVLTAIDPKVGGVLVFGDRGTGKSTAIRAFADLLPPIKVVTGCPVNSEHHIDVPDWVDIASKKTHRINTPVVDLPLGISSDRITGALDIEYALIEGKKRFQTGLLAKANRGYLYIDEVNLLEDHLVDLLLDVAQSGENVVEREGLSIRHASQFILIGSGNPEEGELRPQLLDRFGLSVEVLTPKTVDERIEVIKRRDDYDSNPDEYAKSWDGENKKLRTKIQRAKKNLYSVSVDTSILECCAKICIELGSDGLRGELTLVRTARALAALTGKKSVDIAQVRKIAPMALSHRLRRDPLDDAGSGTRVERSVEKIIG